MNMGRVYNIDSLETRWYPFYLMNQVLMDFDIASVLILARRNMGIDIRQTKPQILIACVYELRAYFYACH